jgi:hypothetical protein
MGLKLGPPNPEIGKIRVYLVLNSLGSRLLGIVFSDTLSHTLVVFGLPISGVVLPSECHN